jgi:hypothetical protein
MELSFLELEAKSKQTIRDVVEPLMNSQADDREGLRAVQGTVKRSEERLKLLEAAVFKADREETLFDVLERRVNEIDIRVRLEADRH